MDQIGNLVPYPFTASKQIAWIRSLCWAGSRLNFGQKIISPDPGLIFSWPGQNTYFRLMAWMISQWKGDRKNIPTKHIISL